MTQPEGSPPKHERGGPVPDWSRSRRIGWFGVLLFVPLAFIPFAAVAGLDLVASGTSTSSWLDRTFFLLPLYAMWIAPALVIPFALGPVSNRLWWLEASCVLVWCAIMLTLFLGAVSQYATAMSGGGGSAAVPLPAMVLPGLIMAGWYALSATLLRRKLYGKDI